MLHFGICKDIFQAGIEVRQGEILGRKGGLGNQLPILKDRPICDMADIMPASRTKGFAPELQYRTAIGRLRGLPGGIHRFPVSAPDRRVDHVDRFAFGKGIYLVENV